MKLIVGLGNPGKQYENTRHNVGQLALKKLVKKISSPLKNEVVLATPGTFMNLSGPAVRHLMQKCHVSSASDMLVLVDDLHLDFGKIRFRPRGSAGGHQGLASIIETLDSESFPRIRIGVGKPEHRQKDWKEYVLEPFTKEERGELDGILERVSECALAWLVESSEKVMQKFN